MCLQNLCLIKSVYASLSAQEVGPVFMEIKPNLYKVTVTNNNNTIVLNC